MKEGKKSRRRGDDVEGREYEEEKSTKDATAKPKDEWSVSCSQAGCRRGLGI